MNSILDQDLPDSINLTKLERLMLLTLIDVKNLMPNIHRFIETSVGVKYTKPPLHDVHKAFLDSSCAVPIVFIVGETADPCGDIYSLSEKLNIVGKRLQCICLYF